MRRLDWMPMLTLSPRPWPLKHVMGMNGWFMPPKPLRVQGLQVRRRPLDSDVINCSLMVVFVDWFCLLIHHLPGTCSPRTLVHSTQTRWRWPLTRSLATWPAYITTTVCMYGMCVTSRTWARSTRPSTTAAACGAWRWVQLGAGGWGIGLISKGLKLNIGHLLSFMYSVELLLVGLMGKSGTP